MVKVVHLMARLWGRRRDSAAFLQEGDAQSQHQLKQGMELFHVFEWSCCVQIGTGELGQVWRRCVISRLARASSNSMERNGSSIIGMGVGRVLPGHNGGWSPGGDNALFVPHRAAESESAKEIRRNERVADLSIPVCQRLPASSRKREFG